MPLWSFQRSLKQSRNKVLPESAIKSNLALFPSVHISSKCIEWLTSFFAVCKSLSNKQPIGTNMNRCFPSILLFLLPRGCCWLCQLLVGTLSLEISGVLPSFPQPCHTLLKVQWQLSSLTPFSCQEELSLCNCCHHKARILDASNI